jgi:hypothetical protein
MSANDRRLDHYRRSGGVLCPSSGQGLGAPMNWLISILAIVWIVLVWIATVPKGHGPEFPKRGQRRAWIKSRTVRP